jgi:prepilin-type N-terminal cleavage/methylation domain-containing protein
MSHAKRKRGFTMVELLVVIGTLAILLMMLMPAIVGAKEKARRMQCMTNEREIGIALQLYANNHDDFFPYRGGPQAFERDQLSDDAGNFSQALGLLLLRGNGKKEILGDPRTLFCPSEPDRTQAAVYPYQDDNCHYGNYEYFGWDVESGGTPPRNRNTARCNPNRALASDLDVTIGNQILRLWGRFGKTHRGDGHNVLYIGGHVRWVPIKVTDTDPARMFYKHAAIDFR